LYHFCEVVLDLQAWVELRRRRVWMLLVCRDVAGSDVAVRAAAIASQIQTQRAVIPARPFRSYLYHPQHPHWGRVLVGLLTTSRSYNTQTTERCAWRQVCQELREDWRSGGFPWADDHPLAGAELRGCGDSERVVEVLEVSLLQACMQHGLDPRRPGELDAAKKGTWCDYSQNDMNTKFGAPRSVCTSTRLYDYYQDRRILAEELLRAMGWQAGGIDTTGIAETDLRDLAGECQALQPLGVASWALLSAVGDGFLGLWSQSRD
jgi:hypothetical protein